MKFSEDRISFDHLYQQFQLSLKLQGKAPKTIDSYLRSFRRLADYFSCHPAKLTQQDLKLYFSDLVDTHSWSSVKIDRWAFKIFWEHVLEKEWNWPKVVKPPKVKTLPDILTIEEVGRIMSTLEKLRYRTCLFTIYSMGLRLGEGVNLKVSDIDSNRHQIHIRNAKGNKDRFIPLPETALNILRHYWASHRNPDLLFPSPYVEVKTMQRTTKIMDRGGVQAAFKLALRDCNIHKKASVRSLRHSYATHLVEAGVNLRLIQEYLGHASPTTTVIYAHLSKPSLTNSEALIQKLMGRFQYTKEKGFFIPNSDK
jgi:integrase/recombinase XerD